MRRICDMGVTSREESYAVEYRKSGGATFPSSGGAGAAPAIVERGPHRCAICTRRLRSSIYFLDETGDVPEPRMSWELCGVCNAAVREEVERSTVRGPLRLRVAVGIVATERTPEARRARIGQLSDQHWETLLFWAFLLFMLGHLVLIVIVASIAK